jgi:hypothetical protein
MAISFRAQTQIASGGATDPMSAPALPTGTTTGDMVLLFVIVKYASTTITTPTDWNLVSDTAIANSGLTDSGNDSGNIRAAIFWREKDAGWSTMPAVDLSGTPDCTMRGVITYQKDGGDPAWATPIGASAADNTVATTGVNPGVASPQIDFGTGDLFGTFAAQNGDAGTFASIAYTVAGVTFVTVNNRLGAATTSGTDLRGFTSEKFYSSGTASAGPDGDFVITTANANCAGVMAFYRLSLASGGASPSPAVTVTTVALPAATVTASASTTQTTIARSFTLPAATAVEHKSVTPATITVTATAPAATVTASAQITPAAIAATVTTPQATPTASAQKTPATIVTTAALPAAAVTAGAAAAPAVIVSTVALPQATTTEGITTTPAAIATLVVLPPATVTASASVTPAAIAAAVTTPAATVTASAQAIVAAIAAVVAMPAATATASGGDVDVTPDVIAVGAPSTSIYLGSTPVSRIYVNP